MAAATNEINFGVSSPDINSEKSYLGKIGIGNDMFSFATTVGWGAEGPPVTNTFGGTDNGQKAGIVDMLANFNSDHFSAYVNADYVWLDGRKPAAWGVSVAGKVPITDLLSAALRLEYVGDKSSNGGFLAAPIDFLPIGTVFNHAEIYGATGTLAYEIVENPTLKGEVRWDHVAEETYGVVPREFFTNTTRGSNDQIVGLGQVIYAF
jgi:hypothetical protein